MDKDEGTKRQMGVVVSPSCVPFLRGRQPEVGVGFKGERRKGRKRCCLGEGSMGLRWKTLWLKREWGGGIWFGAGNGDGWRLWFWWVFG